MTKDSEEEEIEVTDYNPNFDELLETYNNLLDDSKRILDKYGELKVSHSKVLKAFSGMKLEKETLEEKIKSMEEEYSLSSLITENRKLKATVDKLKYDLELFAQGREKLDLILGSQRRHGNKSGLGFIEESPPKKINHQKPVEDDMLDSLMTQPSVEDPKEDQCPQESENQDCFEKLKQIGLEYFLSLNETIYPEMIREFYSNLVFDRESLEASVLLRGRRTRLTKETLSLLLRCPNTGVCPEMVGDVVSASYFREDYIKELIGFESSMCPIGLLSADNRILFHIVDQVVIPRQNKSNDPNNTELFLMWCISKSLKINLPHIILTHFKHICETSQELAYGMVITIIAKYMRVEIEEYEGECAKFQSGKKSRRASPYVRKSARLTKGKGKPEKVVEISDLEDEASSKSIAADISEEVGPQKSIPLSLSFETNSEKAPSPGPSSKPTKATSQPHSDSQKPNVSDDQFALFMHRTLSESRRSSQLHESTLIQLKQIHDTLLATNGALTSILQLLMKLMSEANTAPAATTSVPPSLRSHPRIEDID
ncbi:Fgenesh protein 21 [Senna tora]|uniref:Fgenesh protein 21 n=1 Tax=Senna tora TaxID=362788 RepID=A0A834U1X5_9FABA|nr:Fgenesh protein 21 [Senna tora]